MVPCLLRTLSYIDVNGIAKQWWNIRLINIAPVNWWLVNSQVGCVYVRSDVHNSAATDTATVKLFLFYFRLTHFTVFTVTHSFTARKISFRLPHSNTGWTVVFATCWPDYTFITLTRTGKEVIVPSGHRLRPELHCFQATSSSSSSVLMVCGFMKCESHQRVEWSAICSPVNRRVKAWLNKEPIHALSMMIRVAHSFTL